MDHAGWPGATVSGTASASLRRHYPHQVQRVFLTRPQAQRARARTPSKGGMVSATGPEAIGRHTLDAALRDQLIQMLTDGAGLDIVHP